MTLTVPERLSIELTNQCGKGCSFCYNGSDRVGATLFTVDELCQFAESCVAYGTRAISLGGGEPLEYDGLYELFRRLDGLVFRSMTTNGLLLDDAIDDVVAARPDKVHVSVHFPKNEKEVARVVRQVKMLEERGVTSGVNLLVRRSELSAATHVRKTLHEAGVDNRRIVYLPMRGSDTPTPREVADVAGPPFQSMTCLNECGKSPRFCSIAWDKSVAWCSYTVTRRQMKTLDAAGLAGALDGLGLQFCGDEVPLMPATLKKRDALGSTR